MFLITRLSYTDRSGSRKRYRTQNSLGAIVTQHHRRYCCISSVSSRPRQFSILVLHSVLSLLSKKKKNVKTKIQLKKRAQIR